MHDWNEIGRVADPASAIRKQNERLNELRKRSGMSLDSIAKAMGFKGQSSIQRYFAPTYDKFLRPEILEAFLRAVAGKGQPPIAGEDVREVLDWRPLARMHEPGNREFMTQEAFKTVFEDNDAGLPNPLNPALRLRSSLPVAEGEITLDMPKQLSKESAEAFRNWATHLANLSEQFWFIKKVTTKPETDE